MRLRHCFTFKTSLPFNRQLHPIGEEVVSYLAKALETQTGFHGLVDNWRDSGFEMDFVINDKPVHIAVVHLDDSQFQFYGQVSSYVGWVRRLFGYRDEKELELLIHALHTTLTADSCFSAVFWHEAWYDEAHKSTAP